MPPNPTPRFLLQCLDQSGPWPWSLKGVCPGCMVSRPCLPFTAIRPREGHHRGADRGRLVTRNSVESQGKPGFDSGPTARLPGAENHCGASTRLPPRSHNNEACCHTDFPVPFRDQVSQYRKSPETSAWPTGSTEWTSASLTTHPLWGGSC